MELIVENNVVEVRLEVGEYTGGGGTGPQGIPGEDGLTPTIGENGNWFIGNTDTGVKAEGIDGREVQLQKSATHVQWRYDNDAEWIDLVALSELKGEPGSDANIEAVELESNTVLFDQDYIIGNTSPRTGDILFDFTGAKLGASSIMIHQDANPFTIPDECVVLSGEVSDTDINYFYFLLVDKTEGSEVVHVTISQEV